MTPPGSGAGGVCQNGDAGRVRRFSSGLRVRREVEFSEKKQQLGTA